MLTSTGVQDSKTRCGKSKFSVTRANQLSHSVSVFTVETQNNCQLCRVLCSTTPNLNDENQLQDPTEAFGDNSDDVPGSEHTRTRTTGSESANFAVSAHRRALSNIVNGAVPVVSFVMTAARNAYDASSPRQEGR